MWCGVCSPSCLPAPQPGRVRVARMETAGAAQGNVREHFGKPHVQRHPGVATVWRVTEAPEAEARLPYRG